MLYLYVTALRSLIKHARTGNGATAVPYFTYIIVRPQPIVNSQKLCRQKRGWSLNTKLLLQGTCTVQKFKSRDNICAHASINIIQARTHRKRSTAYFQGTIIY